MVGTGGGLERMAASSEKTGAQYDGRVLQGAHCPDALTSGDLEIFHVPTHALVHTST